MKYRLLLIGCALLSFLFDPRFVFAQEKPHQKKQQEWLVVQKHEDRQVRKDWWQSLSAKQMNAYIKAGVDVNIKDKRKWTPLHSAARYNTELDVLTALLQAGAVVDAKDKSGNTPLHWAAAKNTNVKIISALLQAGANVNARDKFGWIPLHTAAAENSNPDVIETLLQAGSKRKVRAYFILFTPRFILKHNSNMLDQDKIRVQALLK